MLELDAEYAKENAKWTIYDKRDEIYDRMNNYQQEKVDEVQEKIRRMSDKQILYLLKKDDLGSVTKMLLEQEREERNI